MSEPVDIKDERLYEKRVEKARREYEKKNREINKLVENREKFRQKNDELLVSAREKYDENLTKKRKRSDDRISKNRERINSKFIGDDSVKKAKFKDYTDRTDRFISTQRSRQDERISTHRGKVTEFNRNNDERFRKYVSDKRTRELNRLKNAEDKKKSDKAAERFKITVFSAIGLFVVILAIEFLLPGTTLKRQEIIDDTPIDEVLGISKEYEVINTTQDKLLWDALMEHFDGNKTAVLGVMCNLKAESRFEANNLEDYNNSLWSIDDDSYTEKVNRKTISKKDFLESRTKNISNGYYNNYDQWVNKDGGYGYAQYTSYEKKENLYKFAEQWFGPDGEGEKYKFNIGDPRMQAAYVVHLLETDEFKSMDNKIRNAATVVDACYVWLKYYEIPYDPYGDNYYTLAFDRAASADTIKATCDTEDKETVVSTESTEEETETE